MKRIKFRNFFIIFMFSFLACTIQVKAESWLWPLENYGQDKITSGYGPRNITNGSKYHMGIDIGAPQGVPIRAAKSGWIVPKANTGVRGLWAVIDHQDGTYTDYQHMYSITSSSQRMVKQGEIIGTVGHTGGNYGNHLHFEIRTGPRNMANAYDSLTHHNPLNYTYIYSLNESDPGGNPNIYPFPTRDLYYTIPPIKGDDVKYIQSALNYLGYSNTIDGSFGPSTKNAVMQFQKNNGLTADGSCGPATRAKLKQAVNDKMNPTPKDTAAPQVSNPRITGISSNGYTVTCTVTDNSGIDRVQFPTWTTQNGQDDLLGNWEKNPTCTGVKAGNTYSFKVNISSHNNERGVYNTHIYAYDIYGNCKFIKLPTIKVPNPAANVIRINRLALDKSSIKINIGQKAVLKASVFPANASNKNLSWHSSNSKIASVTSSGIVKMSGKGKAVITCTTKDGSKLSRSCTVYSKPVQAKLLSIQPLKKKAKITWKKLSKVSGYEIFMSGSLKGSYSKTAIINNSNAISYTKSKLGSQKKYYFKIRAFYRISGVNIYGNFSTAKYVRVK